MPVFKKRMRGFSLILLILALSFMPFAFVAPAQAAKNLRLAMFADPFSFDPHTASDLNATMFIHQAYDNLFRYNGAGKLVPMLVDSFKISPDAKVQTFTLRKGVKFHDGRELTAKDIKFNLERASIIKGGTAVGYIKTIAGSEAYRKGQAKELKGVEVLDKYTFRVTFSEPHPAFIKQSAATRLAIMNPASISNMKERISLKIALAKGVGSGPFRPVSGRRNFKYVFEPFKDYWRGQSKLPGVELVVVENFVTAMSQYENDELDIITPPYSQIPRIRKDAKLSKEMKVVPRSRSCIIAMNYKVLPQWNDIRIRKAFTHAIDTQKIVEVALEGVVSSGRSVQPPISYGRESNLKGYAYDPEKAKKLLAEAGYPGGKGFPALTLISRSQRHYVRALEAAAGMMNKNLGVNVRVKPMEQGVYIREINKKNIHAFFINCWTASFLDPSYHLEGIMTSGAKRNRWNYADKKFDELVAKAVATVDEDLRMKRFLEAEKRSIEQAAIIPIWYDVFLLLAKPRVQEVEWTPVGNGFTSLWSGRVTN